MYPNKTHQASNQLVNPLNDTYFMQLALQQAYQSKQLGEVPVGAVLVQNNKLLAVGKNCMVNNHDPSAHAEIIALRAAGQVLLNYRLPYTTLYVTLEPCCMCLSAIFHARIQRIVYGASDFKTGACGGYIDLRHISINHHTHIDGGVLQLECTEILQNFFKERRIAIKQLKNNTIN